MDNTFKSIYKDFLDKKGKLILINGKKYLTLRGSTSPSFEYAWASIYGYECEFLLKYGIFK